MGVVRRSARGLLLDGRGRLLLIKRTRPGQPPYWTTPGGGVEPGESLQAALVRELGEELGAQIEVVQPVFLASAPMGAGVAVQHFYVGRVRALHLDRRSGPEFGDPARGRYELAWVDLAGGGLAEVALKPVALKVFVATNIAALLDLAGGGTAPD